MSNVWFNEARYGMFIHWGAYAVGGRGEWLMNRERIPAPEYRELYANNFRAENFAPPEWLRQAHEWGMRYTVLTARHHDGFALWNSAVNEFNAVNYGARRDLVKAYIDACRDAGTKVGIYYSPANRSHPVYPGAYFRDWPGDNDWRDEAARQRFIAYYRAELEELLTNYGAIDYLWFDGCVPGNIDGAETLAHLRKLQPQMLINNRLGEPFDVQVCEQAIRPPTENILWEACMTLNDNWGIHRGDHNWKTPEMVLALLLECAASGGNLLLNVGPQADGPFPPETEKILAPVGEWLKKNRAALTNSERHPFSWNNTARPLTVSGNRVFLHFLKDPGEQFCWAEVKNRVLSAAFLDTGESVNFVQAADRLFLKDLRNAHLRVIALTLDGAPTAQTAQTSFWIPG